MRGALSTGCSCSRRSRAAAGAGRISGILDSLGTPGGGDQVPEQAERPRNALGELAVERVGEVGVASGADLGGERAAALGRLPGVGGLEERGVGRIPGAPELGSALLDPALEVGGADPVRPGQERVLRREDRERAVLLGNLLGAPGSARPGRARARRGPARSCCRARSGARPPPGVVEEPFGRRGKAGAGRPRAGPGDDRVEAAEVGAVERLVVEEGDRGAEGPDRFGNLVAGADDIAHPEATRDLEVERRHPERGGADEVAEREVPGSDAPVSGRGLEPGARVHARGDPEGACRDGAGAHAGTGGSLRLRAGRARPPPRRARTGNRGAARGGRGRLPPRRPVTASEAAKAASSSPSGKTANPGSKAAETGGRISSSRRSWPYGRFDSRRTTGTVSETGTVPLARRNPDGEGRGHRGGRRGQARIAVHPGSGSRRSRSARSRGGARERRGRAGPGTGRRPVAPRPRREPRS